jgi:hypothetical protein
MHSVFYTVRVHGYYFQIWNDLNTLENRPIVSYHKATLLFAARMQVQGFPLRKSTQKVEDKEVEYDRSHCKVCESSAKEIRHVTVCKHITYSDEPFWRYLFKFVYIVWIDLRPQ